MSAVPFTPASGNRLLLLEPNNSDLSNALWEGVQTLIQATQASSIHLLFTPEAHQNLLKDKDVISRMTSQFHWHNNGYESFEHWLSHFKTKARKNTRAERRKAKKVIDRFFWVSGSDLTAKHIEIIWNFYIDTSNRKWGQPYLPRSFFSELNQSLADITLVCFAETNGEIVASSLCFQKGEHLYGRYWGCKEYIDCLHFELCYHQPIALCIQKGWTKFEAGAQGEHKLKRGLLPTPTHSLHWLAHQGLHHAIADFCSKEERDTQRRIALLSEHSPIKTTP